jgi:hypothetical protein
MRLRDSYFPLIIRLVIAGVLLLVGMRVAYTSALLWAYPFWLFAGILIAFPLAEMLAGPFGSFFMPTERFSKPQPMYSIPESLRNKNNLDAAFAAYQKIAQDFPQEIKPYVCMIRMAFVDMNNEALAESVLAQGKFTLKQTALKEELQKDFDAIRTISRVPPTADTRHKISYRKSEV